MRSWRHHKEALSWYPLKRKSHVWIIYVMIKNEKIKCVNCINSHGDMKWELYLNSMFQCWNGERNWGKKFEEISSLCVCACVFYNLKVSHVVSWIYILMANFIFSYAYFLLVPYITSASVALYNEPWILCHWRLQAQFELHLVQTKE